MGRIIMNKNQSLIATLISFGAGVLVLMITIPFFTDAPLEGLLKFFTGPFESGIRIGQWLNQTALLGLTGMGIAIAFGSGVFNLGGEGQVYSSGLAAYAAAFFSFPFLGGISLPLGILAGALFGALVAGVSGVLKAFLKVDELLSSFLLSSALIPLVSMLMTGPALRDPGAKLQVTLALDESLVFPLIHPQWDFNSGLLWVLPVLLLMIILWRYTPLGYKLRMTGQNPSFAAYAGVNTRHYLILPLIFSGLLHGLAGSFLVFGLHGRAIVGFSSFLGWNGISVSLIGRNNPIMVLPAAFLLAYLTTASASATFLPGEIGFLFQGVVLLIVTGSFFIHRQPEGLPKQPVKGDS
jgi:ABC-type uncharacterized transport system permease subunit